MSKSTRFVAGIASDTRLSQDMTTNDHSYVVPDLPNLSELITGTYGTPTVSRSKPTRSSRFAPKQANSTRTIGHKQLDAVPIPEDEKQIFAMLKMLQEKTHTLEKEKAEAYKRAAKAEDEMGNRYRFRRSDSALGTSEDEALARKQRQTSLVAEKKRLETNLSSVQAKLEEAQLQMANIGRYSKKQGKKKAVFDINGTDSEEDNLARPPADQYEPELSQNDTFLTIMNSSSLPQIRKSIEQQRLKRASTSYISRLKGREYRDRVESTQNAGRAASAPPVEPQHSRKAAVNQNKVVTQNFTKDPGPSKLQNPLDDAGEDADMSTNLDLTENLSRPLSELNRRASDPTITAQSNTSRRRVSKYNGGDGDMTSGFFLPDVTITRPNHLSHAAQAVVNAVHPHDKAHCTVCQRLSGVPAPAAAGAAGQGSASRPSSLVKIPALNPPSSRPVAPTPDNPDPTIRPAQPRSTALAIVLKQLGDEVTHLKEELAAEQARYGSHDPSMSWRQRKAVLERIHELERRCEYRSDQVYRLSDVAEGMGGDGEGEGFEVRLE